MNFRTKVITSLAALAAGGGLVVVGSGAAVSAAPQPKAPLSVTQEGPDLQGGADLQSGADVQSGPDLQQGGVDGPETAATPAESAAGA